MNKSHQLKEVRVTSQKILATGAFLLSIEKFTSFKPGQVIALTTNQEISPRLYSIASGINEDAIDILYTIQPEGMLTPQLSNLKSGDRIFASEAFGDFLYDDSPAFWIASGTGIAPFASMIKSGLHAQKTLIYGARYPENFYFDDVLNNCLSNNYIKCCSACKDGAFYTGRLTNYIMENDLDSGKKYFLCGSAEMVVDVRDLLINKNVAYNNIHAEIYF